MKHLSKMTWLLAAIALFLAGNLVFTACTKEEFLQTEMADNAKGSEVLTTTGATDRSDSSQIWLDMVRRKNGMLQYQDGYHFMKVMETLEAQYEAHNADFYNPLAKSDIEFVRQEEVRHTFNPYLPLDFFEKSKEFVSQRRETEVLFQDWIKSSSKPDLNTDPRKEKVMDLALSTMIDSDGKYMIGDKIQSVTVQSSKSTPNPEREICSPFARDSEEGEYASGLRKLEIVMQLVQIGFIISGTRLTTTLTHFQRNSIGDNWNRATADLFVSQSGNRFDIGCTLREDINAFDSGRRSRISCSRTGFTTFNIHASAFTDTMFGLGQEGTTFIRTSI